MSPTPELDHLAKRAVGLLHQRLSDMLGGAQVQTGAEIEVLAPEADNVTVPINLDLVNEKELQGLPGNPKLKPEAQSLGQFEMQLDPARPERTAARIPAWKSVMARELPKRGSHLVTFNGFTRLQGTSDFGGHSRSIENRNCNALHISLSFTDHDQNLMLAEKGERERYAQTEPKFDFLTRPSELAQQMISAPMAEAMQHNLLLFAHSQNAYERFQNRGFNAHVPGYFSVGMQDDPEYENGRQVKIGATKNSGHAVLLRRNNAESPENMRVEFRVGDGNANPWLLMTGVLESAIATLENHVAVKDGAVHVTEKSPPSPSVDQAVPLYKSLEEAQQAFFAPSNPLRKRLNALDPNHCLGDDFFNQLQTELAKGTLERPTHETVRHY